MPNENGKYIASEGICDFCSSSDLFYGYLASDFTAAEVAVPNVCTFVLNSLGAWLACRECTRLIEQENWEGLLERSFRTFCETHGPELVLNARGRAVRSENFFGTSMPSFADSADLELNRPRDGNRSQESTEELRQPSMVWCYPAHERVHLRLTEPSGSVLPL